MPRPSPARRLRHRPSRASYHHGDLPRALLDAALALLRKHGSRGLTLRAAARRVGVSQTAPYRHFRDKEALLAAVAEEGFRALKDATGRAADEFPRDPVRKLQAIGVAYVRFAATHPDHYRVMFGPEVPDKPAHPPLHVAALNAFWTLSEAISEGQRAGKIRSGDPQELAVTAWALVHGLASLAVDRQIPSSAVPGAKRLTQLSERVNRLLIEGLLRRR